MRVDNITESVNIPPSASAEKVNGSIANTVTHRRMRKASAILIAATLALTLMTGVALATGVAQTIFRSMMGQIAVDDATGGYYHME